MLRKCFVLGFEPSLNLKTGVIGTEQDRGGQVEINAPEAWASRATAKWPVQCDLAQNRNMAFQKNVGYAIVIEMGFALQSEDNLKLAF